MDRALRRRQRQAKIAARVARLRIHWGLDWAENSHWVREPGRLDKLAVNTRYTKYRDYPDTRLGVFRDELEGFLGVLRKPNRIRRSPQFSAPERRGGWPGTRLAAGSVPPQDRNDRIVVCRDGRYHVRDGARVVLVTDSWRTAFKARNPDSDWCWLDELMQR